MPKVKQISPRHKALKSQANIVIKKLKLKKMVDKEVMDRQIKYRKL